ncbi:THO complex subunit 5B [Ranunculus cassubicifolius]
MEVDDEVPPSTSTSTSILPVVKIEKTAYEKLEESRISTEEIAAKMLFIKKEGRPKSELRELVTQMSLHLVTLRQANRSILLEEDHVKSETERAKAPVDFTTLQLHNLLYEKNHYVKAIKACTDFKSKFPDIRLIPNFPSIASFHDLHPRSRANFTDPLFSLRNEDRCRLFACLFGWKR